MATKTYTDENLNYFCLCYVITHNVPEGLRTVFKQQWDARYQATHGQWLDIPANATDFYNMESPRNQRRNARLLTIMANGNTNQWDCTCLFYAILLSDCLGPFLNPTVQKSVDELREIRNEVFAHTADGRLTDVDFEDAMRKIFAAFKTLDLNTVEVEAIKNQKTFPTDKLRRIQENLNDEKKRYAKINSFCVLPPKPSHDTTDRADEVTTINHEMEKLRSTKKNETTVIYLSGNPGCGKSEIARQIGNEYFDKIPEEAAQLKFVFTFNASSIDTLLQSYVDFAFRLNCDEEVVKRIASSKDLGVEDKINQMKILISPKVHIYSSWLIIVDNLNNLKLVSRYLPQAGEKTSGDGQILVTTQDSQAIPFDSYTYHYPSLKEGMKEDDAIALLAQISGITGDRDTLLNIARALDFQPLALACAAVYMQHVFHYADQSEAKWEKYLLKLQEGKREAIEEAFAKTTKTYKSAMTSAVKLALDKVVKEDQIMMHAFHFLSVIANEPIPLKYVVQHVMNCMPDKDQDFVAAHISSSSLVILSEDMGMSKAVRVHQVVYDGLQKLFKNNGSDIMKLMSVFSDLPSFKTVYDVTKEEIITTRSFTPHFVAISGKLKDLLPGHSDLTDESRTADCLFKAGSICNTQGSYKASVIFLELCLSIQQRACDFVLTEVAACQSLVISNVSEMNKSQENKQSHFEEKRACSSNRSVALATTLNSLGKLYSRLEDYEKAQIHLESALAIEERLYNGDNPELAITLRNLGYCLFHRKQYGKAEEYLQKALAIQEKESGKNDHLLADILVDLILVLQSQGKSVKAKSYFDRVLELEHKLHEIENPQLSVTIRHLGLCSSYFKNEQKATRLYEKSLEIDESVYGANHPCMALTKINLGRCLHRLGENERAKSYFEEALAICENGNHENDALLPFLLENLGWCLIELRQFEKAQEYLERGLSVCEKKGKERDRDLAFLLSELGGCFFQQRLYEKAKVYYERALCILESQDDQQLDNTIACLNNIGACHIRQRQYEKAKTYLERALSFHEKRGNQNDPQLARTLHYIGKCLYQQKDYVKATAYLERALSLYEKGEDENDPQLSEVLIGLGSCLNYRRQYGKAKACYERALSIQEKVNDPEIATTLHNLGSSLTSLKEYDKAKACFKRALSIQEKVGDGNEDTKLLSTLYGLGVCLKEQGHYGEAIEYLERGVTIIFEKGDDEHDPHLSRTLNYFDFCLMKTGQHRKAKAYWEKALCIFESKDDQQMDEKINFLNNIGACHIRQRQYEKAKTYLERALSFHEKQGNENDPQLAKTLHYIGKCLHQQKDYVEATTYMERALSVYEKGEDENDPQLAEVLTGLGSCLDNRRQYDRAKACFVRALSIQEKVNDPEIATTLDILGSCLTSLKEYDKAKACLERALVIHEKGNDPKLPYTLRRLGWCLKEQGQYEDAIVYLVRAVSIFEMYGDSENQLANARRELDIGLEKQGENPYDFCIIVHYVIAAMLGVFLQNIFN